MGMRELLLMTVSRVVMSIWGEYWNYGCTAAKRSRSDLALNWVSEAYRAENTALKIWNFYYSNFKVFMNSL